MQGANIKIFSKNVEKIRKARKNSDLVIDIGNTRIKIAMFVNDKLVEVLSFSNQSAKEISGLIEKSGARRGILSAVTHVEPALKSLLSERMELLEVSKATKLPITIGYNSPETLGTDRIANAVAAAKFYAKSDVLIIDFGTCIKYDLVNADGIFCGGAIAPGVTMRFESMHRMTGKLPLISDWESSNVSWPGKSTRESMIAGVMLGIEGEMAQYIERAANDYDSLMIISTGGDFSFFEKAYKNIIFAHPYLTLEGLHEILKFNID